MSSADDDEDYFVPLEDQRVFGAGLKRKRVAFVPASSADRDSDNIAPKPRSGSSIGDRYLSIVLPASSSNSPKAAETESSQSSQPTVEHNHEDRPGPSTAAEETVAVNSLSELCPVCNLPLNTPTPSSTPHESSISHQVALPHSHPPSHLPREHIGLKYLSTYGWDPDSRLGLGARGTGIRIPIKGKEKNDTVGLGLELSSKPTSRNGSPASRGDGVIKRLNAKEVRKLEEEGKRRREQLQRIFYQSDDVSRYLGEKG